jgi:copper chaperone CopZ
MSSKLQRKLDKRAGENMKTVTYTIPNISCHHCIHTIKSELSELSGVLSVQGDVATKQVAITYEEPASNEKIEDLLTEIEYPPQK